jgi:hypothetical protein
MKELNRWISTGALGLFLLFTCGCAQVLAIREPRPFTPTSTVVGVKRTAVVGELGQPAATEMHGTNLVDTFKYADGGSKNYGGSKAARVVLYTAGDLFTLWLDQMVLMPVELGGFSGTDHIVVVDYCKNNDDLWLVSAVDDRIYKAPPSPSVTTRPPARRAAWP